MLSQKGASNISNKAFKSYTGYEEIHIFGPEYQANTTFRNITFLQLAVLIPATIYFGKKAKESETNWKYLLYPVAGILGGFSFFNIMMATATRRKIVNNMYLLLPQNVLRVETLGFFPGTKRVHVIPVTRTIYLTFLSNVLSVSNPHQGVGVNEDVNHQTATFIQNNFSQVKKVNVLRMSIRNKFHDMFFYDINGSMRDQKLFDIIKRGGVKIE